MRNAGQKNCHRCGRNSRHFVTQGCPDNRCPMTPEVWAALLRFKAAEGRYWKTRLCGDWSVGCVGTWDRTERALLMQARNILGPSCLYKIKL